MRGVGCRKAGSACGSPHDLTALRLCRAQLALVAHSHSPFARVKYPLRSWMAVVAVVSVFVCKVNHSGAATHELEAFFYDRDSWASGDVTITGTHYSGGTFVETMHVTFDEGFRKIRSVYTMPGREVRFARNDRDSLLYVDGSRVVVKDLPDRKWAVPHATPFDVRIVGFTTYSCANARKSYPEVAALIRSHPVDLVEVEPTGLHRVEWVLAPTETECVRRKIWCDPRMRFAPIRIEFWRETLSNTQVVDRTRVLDGTAEYCMKDDIWVPTKWQVDNEGTGIDWRFQWHSFNQPIDDSRFQIEGMDLPAGTVVENRTLGTRIIESRIGDRIGQPSEEPPPGGQWAAWLVGGNACALIMVVCIWLYRSRMVRSSRWRHRDGAETQ